MLTNHRAFVLTISVALTLLFVGCADDPRGRQAIDGTVTFDGVPLSHGNVRFEPASPGEATAAGAVIADGRFQVDREQGLAPGVYRVSISSPGALLKENPGDEGGLSEELVPASYNQATTLEITVTGDGDNTFPFDLTSDTQG